MKQIFEMFCGAATNVASLIIWQNVWYILPVNGQNEAYLAASGRHQCDLRKSQQWKIWFVGAVYQVNRFSLSNEWSCLPCSLGVKWFLLLHYIYIHAASKKLYSGSRFAHSLWPTAFLPAFKKQIMRRRWLHAAKMNSLGSSRCKANKMTQMQCLTQMG